MRYSSHIPEPLRRAPRGGGFFNIIALIATAILTGGIGLGILAVIDSQSCLVNIFWGCGGGTTGTVTPGGTLCASASNSCGQTAIGYLQTSYSCPSGWTLSNTTCYQGCPVDKNGQPFLATDKNGSPLPGCSSEAATETQSCSAPTPPNSSCPVPCTSAPNACGQTSTGTITNGVCSASTPSNASCPQPKINDPGFYPQPSTLHGGGTQGIDPPPNNGTTLFWNTSNTTSCTITGDNGFSFTTTKSKGSVGTGTLWQTTSFTLTCEDGAGGPTVSRGTKVIVDPHYKEV